MAEATPTGVKSSLADLLDGRVDDLRSLLRRALQSWDVEAIHHARVTTRRLKAATDLLRPLLPDEPRKAFARALRKIRQTLGPLRDLDVMLMHLEAMKPPAPEAPAAEWVVKRLRERRHELREAVERRSPVRKLLGRLDEWVDLEPEVRRSQVQAAALIRRVAPARMQDFAARAAAVAHVPAAGDGNALAAPEQAPQLQAPQPQAAPDDVHELRISGKLVRYTLELAGPLGLDVPKAVEKDFKKLQDALGLWHDYAVLTDEMLRLALDAQLGIHHPTTHGAVLKLASSCFKDAQGHLERFRKLWLAGGEALTASVTSVFGQRTVRVAAGTDEPPAVSPAPSGDNGSAESSASQII